MSEWKPAKLGDIAEMCLGKMLDKEKNKGVLQPYLANLNVRWGGFELLNLSTMRFEESESERYGLRSGDLVICEGGEPGRCAIWRDEVPEMKIQKAIHRLRTNKNYSNEFVYYQFLLAGRSGELAKHFNGSTIKHLTGYSLKQVEFKFPPLAEQNRIAAVLSTLDAKIALNHRINGELEGLAKLLYDYWFVQYDFPLSAAQAAALGKPKLAGQPYRTSGGKMLYHPELKREIPKEWEVHNLGDILSISRGASPRPIDEFLSDSGIPWIKISDATASDNRFILETKQFILKKGGPMAKIVPPDTLILTNSATPAVPRITKIHSGVHDGWLVINDYTSGLSKDFMFHYFCHERPRIICLGNGSIFKNLKTDYIKGLKIALPPNGIWSEATDHFKLISDQIYNATQQNQELTALRDWLLPMLMNGQVRVTE